MLITCMLNAARRCLPFDMWGGQQQAKPDVERPFDGRMKPWVSLHDREVPSFSLWEGIKHDNVADCAGDSMLCYLLVFG